MNGFDSLLVSSLPFFPRKIIGIVAKPYIAGETTEAALNRARQLVNQGFLTTVDLLGENVSSMKEAQDCSNTYQALLEKIQQSGLETTLSIKPTQFGLKKNKEACHKLIYGLIQKAAQHKTFVRIEMENSTCTTDTIELYRSLRADFSNTGIVFQAYLHRTERDVTKITGIPQNVRIVKGVYVESSDIAFQDPNAITNNYIKLAETLLENGAYVAFATHDQLLISKVMELIDRLGVSSDSYEFQMLLGVQERLRNTIRDEGHPMRVYIPFGKDWYPYSMRRLRQNPKIARYIMRETLRFR